MIRKVIIIILLTGICIMANSEKPLTSWNEYNYSFLEIRKLQKSANNRKYEDAYKLGMHYYLIKKNDKKSIYWLEKAASGNYIEAIRELIRYYLFVDTDESKELLKLYKQQLEETALVNMKPENFYYADLDLDSFRKTWFNKKQVEKLLKQGAKSRTVGEGCVEVNLRSNKPIKADIVSLTVTEKYAGLSRKEQKALHGAYEKVMNIINTAKNNGGASHFYKSIDSNTGTQGNRCDFLTTGEIKLGS